VQQLERILHQEIDVRLRALGADLVWISPPNGVYLPARTDSEKRIAGRIVSQLKTGGMLTPGAADYVFLWNGGCGCIELKREAAKTLLGKVRAGKQSDDQIAFQARCERAGVPYRVARSWDEVKAALVDWGAL
jgi:hypothetical protein